MEIAFVVRSGRRTGIGSTPGTKTAFENRVRCVSIASYQETHGYITKSILGKGDEELIWR
jgi:hypothetical protein